MTADDTSTPKGQAAEETAEAPFSPNPFVPPGVNTFPEGLVIDRRYRVVRFIAQGGMGEVYEVEDLQLGERVALKTLRPDVAGRRAALERFKREVQLARRVTHPGICRIFDVGFGKEDGEALSGAREIPFLTMELLRGETLGTRLASRGRFKAAEALPVVEQLSAALAAAHRLGIVHRDFKSGNVMLVPDPVAGERAVITDFGLACLSEGAPESPAPISSTGAVIGTPAYMSPEQVEGKSVTPSADIFAFGIVLYEMMTGVLPFQGDSPLQSAICRLTGQVTPPRVHAPDLPVLWENVILKCLERSPKDRFSGIEAVRECLVKGLNPGRGRVRRLTRSRLLFGIVLGALGATLLGLLLTTRPWGPVAGRPTLPRPAEAPAEAAKPARISLAVFPFRNHSGRETEAWVSTAFAEMLSTELAAGGLFRIVPGETVAGALSDLSAKGADSYSRETLRRLRETLGADRLVLGSFLSGGPGRTIRVDLKVQDTGTGEIVLALSDSDPDILALVNRAGDRLRQQLGGLEIGSADRGALTAAKPSKPEAARFYAEGIGSLWRNDALSARDFFLKTIAVDRDFPLAYARLSAAWSALGYDERAREAAGEAVKRSANLSREDRLLIEGRHRESTRDWAGAAESYRTLYGFFPDNLEYGLRLAKVQAEADRFNDASATVAALKRLPPPMREDPRIDLVEADVAFRQGDYHRTLSAGQEASRKGDRLEARSVAASGRYIEGWALYFLGNLGTAARRYEEARALFQAAGDGYNTANALRGLGTVLSRQGRYDEAERLFNQALGVYRSCGNRSGEAISYNHLASVAQYRGEVAAARAHYEHSIRIRRELGNRRALAIALGNLGILVRDQGDLGYAERLFREELENARAVGSRDLAAVSLANIGSLAGLRGELVRATEVYREAVSLSRSLGGIEERVLACRGLASVCLDRGMLAEARASAQEIVQATSTSQDTLSQLESGLTLARVSLAENRLPEVRQLLARLTKLSDLAGEPATRAALLAIRAETGWMAGEPAGKIQAAARELWSLAAGKPGGEFREAALTAARLLARTGAVREARDAHARLAAGLKGTPIVRLQLQEQLALGEIELASGDAAAGRSRLRALARKAREKGYVLLARQAEGVR